MDLSDLLFDTGEKITGWGEIRVDQDGTWFDPSHPVALMWLHPGQRHPRSRSAVRISGAEFDNRNPSDGTWGTVSGTWTGQGISVLAIDPAPPADRGQVPTNTRWVVPPGPAPAGGWPDGTQQDILDLDLQESRRTENCVATVLYRPRDNCAVLVVAATDVALAEAQWRPTVGDRLCVVASRWSNSQLDGIRNALKERWEHWKITTISRPTDQDAQTSVEVALLRVTPEMVRWAAEIPDGILAVTPTLVPEQRPAEST